LERASKDPIMPEAFDKCRKQGGKIRTIKPREDVYIHICIDANGRTHAGDVHHVGETKGKQVKQKTSKVYFGPRGGRYILDKNGEKLYLSKIIGFSRSKPLLHKPDNLTT
jgi:hypothetical protein